MIKTCTIRLRLLQAAALLSLLRAPTLFAQAKLPYPTYTTFSQLLEGSGASHLPVTRVSEPGTAQKPIYTGFFFYQCLQFDTTGRYLLGMRVYIQNRLVQATDRGDIGFIDLKD